MRVTISPNDMSRGPASETADLETALKFVIGRIDEEANRSGQPLSDDERVLLNNLPTDSPLLQNTPASEEYPAVVVLRDEIYERLCALAKAAYDFDQQLNAAGKWEFAAAASTLYRHPMSWLLWWAGVKTPNPLGDRWLLGVGALLSICCAMASALIMLVGHNLTRSLLAIVAAACIATVVLLYFVSQRTERRQLEQAIERYR